FEGSATPYPRRSRSKRRDRRGRRRPLVAGRTCPEPPWSRNGEAHGSCGPGEARGSCGPGEARGPRNRPGAQPVRRPRSSPDAPRPRRGGHNSPKRRLHGPEADAAFGLGTDLDVGDPVRRHDDQPAPLVAQPQQTVLERAADGGLDILRLLAALEHDLTRSVLNADLDLHGPPTFASAGETYDRPIYPAACGGALARSALGRVRAHCAGTGRGAWERSRELPARSRPPGDGQASTPSRKRRSAEDDGTNDVQRWTPRT